MVSEAEYIKLYITGLLDLDLMSKEYDISKNELIRFHNSHCNISELLPLNLPKYVPFIYIPKVKFDAKSSQSLPHSTLEYPSTSSEKNYGVLIKYLHNDSQIHYKINIRRAANLVVISKCKNYINNAEADSIIEKLYAEAEQAIYPLKISVQKNGSLSKIENENEILDRWKNECLPKLRDYYVGKMSEEILGKMDNVFQNLNSRKDYLLQTIFYKFFFFPVYQTYPGYRKSGSLEFYFAGIQKHISYDFEYFLNKEYTRGTKIALQIKGTERENPFDSNIEKGKIDMLYKFHKETHELFSITGFVSTFDKGKELKTEVQIFEISDLN